MLFFTGWGDKINRTLWFGSLIERATVFLLEIMINFKLFIAILLTLYQWYYMVELSPGGIENGIYHKNLINKQELLMFMNQNPTGTKKEAAAIKKEAEPYGQKALLRLATIPLCRQKEKNIACEDGMRTRVNGGRRSAHKILSGRSVLSYGKIAG